MRSKFFAKEKVPFRNSITFGNFSTIYFLLLSFLILFFIFQERGWGIAEYWNPKFWDLKFCSKVAHAL